VQGLHRLFTKFNSIEELLQTALRNLPDQADRKHADENAASHLPSTSTSQPSRPSHVVPPVLESSPLSQNVKTETGMITPPRTKSPRSSSLALDASARLGTMAHASGLSSLPFIPAQDDPSHLPPPSPDTTACRSPAELSLHGGLLFATQEAKSLKFSGVFAEWDLYYAQLLTRFSHLDCSAHRLMTMSDTDWSQCLRCSSHGAAWYSLSLTVYKTLWALWFTDPKGVNVGVKNLSAEMQMVSHTFLQTFGLPKSVTSMS